MRDPNLQNKILFVLANKQDVEGALSAEDVAKKLKLTQYEGKRPFYCRGVSAKSGDHVQESMNELAKEMKKHLKAQAKADKEKQRENN